MLENLSAELPSFKGVVEATSSCFMYLGNILNSSIFEGFEGGLLCGMQPRGEGASYTAVEMQLEKQSHPGNTLKEIGKGRGFFCIPNEMEGQLMPLSLLLLSSISPRVWQLAAQGKEVKGSYRHLMSAAEAFREKCWVLRPGWRRPKVPRHWETQQMVQKTLMSLHSTQAQALIIRDKAKWCVSPVLWCFLGKD